MIRGLISTGPSPSATDGNHELSRRAGQFPTGPADSPGSVPPPRSNSAADRGDRGLEGSSSLRCKVSRAGTLQIHLNKEGGVVDAFHRRGRLSGCRNGLTWLGPGARRLRARQLRPRLRDRSILQPAGLQPALVQRSVPRLQSLLLRLLRALRDFRPQLLQLVRAERLLLSRLVPLPVWRSPFAVVGLSGAGDRTWICLPRRGLLPRRLRQSLRRRCILPEWDASRRRRVCRDKGRHRRCWSWALCPGGAGHPAPRPAQTTDQPADRPGQSEL